MASLAQYEKAEINSSLTALIAYLVYLHTEAPCPPLQLWHLSLIPEYHSGG